LIFVSRRLSSPSNKRGLGGVSGDRREERRGRRELRCSCVTKVISLCDKKCKNRRKNIT